MAALTRRRVGIGRKSIVWWLLVSFGGFFFFVFPPCSLFSFSKYQANEFISYECIVVLVLIIVAIIVILSQTVMKK